MGRKNRRDTNSNAKPLDCEGLMRELHREAASRRPKKQWRSHTKEVRSYE